MLRLLCVWCPPCCFGPSCLPDDLGTPESAGFWEGSIHGSEVSFIKEDDGDGPVVLIQVAHLADVLLTYDLSKLLAHGFKSLRERQAAVFTKAVSMVDGSEW